MRVIGGEPARRILIILLFAVPLLPNPSPFTNHDAPKWGLLALGTLLAVVLVMIQALRSPDAVRVTLPEHLSFLTLLVVVAFFAAKTAPDPRATYRAWALIGTLAAFGILAARYLKEGAWAEASFATTAAAGALAGLFAIAGAFGAPYGPETFFGNPSFAAEFAAPALVLAAALFFMGKRLLGAGLAAPLLALLVLSKSRADWLGLIAAAATLGLLELARVRKWKLPHRPLTAALLLGILALPWVFQVLPVPLFGNSDTVKVRDHTRAAALRMAMDHPMQGVGLEGFAAAYPDYRSPEEYRISHGREVTFPHNLPLSVFSEAGLPGLCFLLLFLWITLSAGVGTVLLRPDDGVAFGALGGLVTLLVSAQFSAPLRHPASAALFFLLAALLVARRPRRYVADLKGRYRRFVPMLVLAVGPVAAVVILPSHLIADIHLKSARDRLVEFDGGMDESFAEQLRKSVEAEPSRDALRMLATYDLAQTPPRTEAAFEKLERLYKLSPGYPRGRIEEARALEFEGRSDDAFRILRDLDSKRPGDPIVGLLLARSYLARNRPQEALATLRELNRDELDDPRVVTLHLEALFGAMKVAPLWVVGEHAKLVNDRYPLEVIGLIRMAERIGKDDLDRGIAILESIEGAEALFFRAVLYANHRVYDEAMSNLRGAVNQGSATQERLRNHPGLEPLRGRADFRSLLR